MFIRSNTMIKILRGLLFGFCLLCCVAFIACNTSPSRGAFLSADSERCIGCRKCVVVCNSDAIIIISNKAVIDVSKCVQCFKCIDACPVDAIE